MSNYGVIILGGTGQVGSTVVKALMNAPRCSEVLMVTRRTITNEYGEKCRQIVLDTEKPEFEAEVAELAKSCSTRPLHGASCVGVGKGSANWAEEDLLKLEIGVVGAFARGCRAGGVDSFSLLTALGSDSSSRIRYTRIMGRKEEAIQDIHFPQLAIFRPGIIGGNVHTPRVVDLLGRLLPFSFGTIDQEDIGRAFVRHFERENAPNLSIYYNRDMWKND